MTDVSDTPTTAPGTDVPNDRARPDGRRIGYVTSRFPKTTETFIVREIVAVEASGHHVDVYAIRREHDQIVQPGAEHLVDRLTAISDLGIGAARAQWRWARRSPRRLATMWWRAVRGNITSPPFLLRGLAVAWGAPAIADATERDEIEHLHAHWATHAALLAHLVHVLTDVPYSVTLHAHDLYVDTTMLGTKLDHAAAAVTISEHNADIIRRDHPDVGDRLAVVRCGVDSSRIVPRAPRPVGEPLKLVTVARFEPMKGHADLIGALSILRDRGRAVRADLLGDGDGRDEIEAQAGHEVVFHGSVDSTVVERVVRDADLMVLPCVEMPDGRRDGIPVALMEAMALGVPVLSTRVSGIPELIVDGETGLLVDQHDPAGIADAIERLADDPDLAERLARNARRHVESMYDADANGREMAALFTRLAPCFHDLPSGNTPGAATTTNDGDT